MDGTLPEPVGVAYGYIRVSTSKQELSPQAQKTIITGIAQTHGFSLEIYEDLGTSAFGQKQRPVLDELRAKLKSGEASALIVAKIDRLTRDTITGLQLLKDSQEQGWKVIAGDFNVDSNTAVGRLMLSVLFSVATFESDRRSERMVEHYAVKKELGDSSGHGVKVSPVVVTLIHKLKKDGLTAVKTVAYLESHGILTARDNPKWSQQMVYKLLRRPDPGVDLGQLPPVGCHRIPTCGLHGIENSKESSTIGGKEPWELSDEELLSVGT